MTSDRVQRQIDRLLDEAEEAVSELSWAVVRDRGNAVLGFDPENRDAFAFLTAADRALGVASHETETPPMLRPESSEPPAPSFKDGRYLVKQLLGEGASKRVYLVHDTLLDREVAFALIKVEGLDELGRERILREARAMARLGDHSNIVQLHDLGGEGGRPYMVLPLMKGGDLESLLRNAPDHRLPVSETLSNRGRRMPRPGVRPLKRDRAPGH